MDLRWMRSERSSLTGFHRKVSSEKPETNGEISSKAGARYGQGFRMTEKRLSEVKERRVFSERHF